MASVSRLVRGGQKRACRVRGVWRVSAAGDRAIRAGKWKLVSKHDQPWELYDLEADRTEMNDLAARMPDRVKELAAQWAQRTNVLPYPRPGTQSRTAR